MADDAGKGPSSSRDKSSSLREKQSQLYAEGGRFGMPNRRTGTYEYAAPANRPPKTHQRSKCMSAYEISSILRAQWIGVHSAAPYVEDFYFQAWLAKTFPGLNREMFAPDQIRGPDTDSMERLSSNDDRSSLFVKLSGLGRVAYSNIRRPRPLMDISTEELEHKTPEGPQGEESIEGSAPEIPKGKSPLSGKTQTEAIHKRRRSALDRDPVLAGHVMMEDCMHLLLDVDDLDRKVLSAGNPPSADVVGLRAKMMESLADALSIHPTPHGNADAKEAREDVKRGDDMLRRIALLRKGRHVLAKAIGALLPPYPPLVGSEDGVLSPPPPPPSARMAILWSVLRCARRVFRHASLPTELIPDREEAKVVSKQGDLTPATVRVASAIIRCLYALPDAHAVCDALEALVAGDLVPKDENVAVLDLLLPLRPDVEAGQARRDDDERPWLGLILVALMERAEQVDANRDLRWAALFGKLVAVIETHFVTIAEVFKAAKAAGSKDACERAQQEVPVHVVVRLLQAMQAHVSEAQGTTLATALTEVFEEI